MRSRSLIPLGDRALTIDFPDDGGVPVRDLLHSLTERLRAERAAGITGIVPAIRTLTVHYDPALVDFDALHDYLGHTVDTVQVSARVARAPVTIPVCYGGEFGPDLEGVATTHRTTTDAIVAAHTAGRYSVAMIGFLPGFPYLDGLAPGLHTPRRASPRTSVPAGSVGIGGGSTGVYPCTSPGGWQLIGRTPLALFAPDRLPPALLQPGDQVRFVAISPAQWLEHV